MTKQERASFLADELALRWLHRIPVDEQQAFVNMVRWSIQSASLEPGEHLLENGVVYVYDQTH